MFKLLICNINFRIVLRNLQFYQKLNYFFRINSLIVSLNITFAAENNGVKIFVGNFVVLKL